MTLLYLKGGVFTMSRFLGPVHHWLYNKICLHEDLEKNIVSGFNERYDTDNIHGWLQSKIKVIACILAIGMRLL